MRDIKIGDKVCDHYGAVQRVIAKHSEDSHPFYRMSFSDGTDVLCGPEHLWLAWRAHVGTKKRNAYNADSSGRVHGDAAARVMRTDQIMAEMAKGRRYRIPLAKPAVGNFNRYKIDPYVLGAFLGDGHMPEDLSRTCHIVGHEDDVEVMEEIERRLEDGEFVYERQNTRPHLLTGRLCNTFKTHDRLLWMGMLGKRSWEKELPASACFAPIEWRWELLQGLMDTDGWCEPKRCAYYCTTSPKLRDGVAALARSLGCFVTIADKAPTYTYKGQTLDGRPAWVLRIKSATPEKLFRLDRKRKIAAELQHQSLAKEITGIEYVGKRPGACIQVDHPMGLYLTNDYTVTHNSGLIALLTLLDHEKCVCFRYDGKQMKALVDDLIVFHGTRQGLNRGHSIFTFQDRPGHFFEWGGLGKPGSEKDWKGRPHDLICFDEVTELRLASVLYVQTHFSCSSRDRSCLLYTSPSPRDS